VKTKTILNLSHLPEEVILSIENTLKSKTETVVKVKDIEVESCVDYGYFYVIKMLLKQLRIKEVLSKTLPEETVPLIELMIMGMLITTNSKLGISNWIKREKYFAEHLGLESKKLNEKVLYNGLIELATGKKEIDKKWFRYHGLQGNSIYLYDITSTYFEGKENELSAFGYNRDGKKGKMQICMGLITDDSGFPLKIDVFKGNTIDSETVEEQIKGLQKEFGVKNLVFVGDRGMRIIYHIEHAESIESEHIRFITGLTRSEIKDLIDNGIIDLNLFNYPLAEVSDEKYRYILSVNPQLAEEQSGYLFCQKDKTEALIEQVKESWMKRRHKNIENELNQIKGKTKNSKLKISFSEKDIDRFKLRINNILSNSKFGKYYTIETIDNDKFNIVFNQEKFDFDLQLCGKYVLCSNAEKEELSKEDIRIKYKCLQQVEHSFRDFKSDLISVRPVHHRLKETTVGHVQICFFAYAIIKALEDKLFPFLKEYNRKNKTMLSFTDLIAELQNVKLCKLRIGAQSGIIKFPSLNPLQTEIFNILKINANELMRIEN
jgi:transposase